MTSDTPFILKQKTKNGKPAMEITRNETVEAKDPGQHYARLIYICAPLRGDVARNIEFARQKAQAIFQSGNTPICPHMMFPPIADPTNPDQDLAARQMGLRLLESCDQVNVYGPVWTDGMLAEIQYAMDQGIPILTDQSELPAQMGTPRPAQPAEPQRKAYVNPIPAIDTGKIFEMRLTVRFNEPIPVEEAKHTTANYILNQPAETLATWINCAAIKPMYPDDLTWEQKIKMGIIPDTKRQEDVP